ncbi:helix-turn-helix transcriptional regulator [Exiguobacterium undae]|uniref:HTH cro/C1-type domain-containing protein n=1 Tax=Exiguobacterium undae TaxID=169177 RepID=A0ABX2V5J9_9BACL|nr:helix-turn-helix transcriptional regulator [Exiguobacterium undae]OAN10118.1 hypothetical protein A3783_15250 [Exiguobacterium undae]
MSSVGELLRSVRKQRKMTQDQLSKGIVNRSYISQIEKNLVQPSFKTMTQLSKRLDIDVSIFYGETELVVLSISEIKNLIRTSKQQLQLNQAYSIKNSVKKLIELPLDQLNKLSVSEKCDYYYSISLYYFLDKKYDESLKYTEKGLDISKQNHSDVHHTEFLIQISKCYIQKNQYHDALRYLNEAHNLIVSSQLSNLLKIEVLLNMGICHGRIGEYYSSIRLCNEANHINELSNSTHKSGELFMTLGICYKKINDLKASKKYYEKANSFFTLFNNTFNKAGTLVNLGIIYREMNNASKSLEYLYTAKTNFEELNDTYQIWNCKIEIFKSTLLEDKFTINNVEEEFRSLITYLPNAFINLKTDLYITMLTCYLSHEKYEEALNLINNTDNFSEKDLYFAKIYFNLGLIDKSSYFFNKYHSENSK